MKTDSEARMVRLPEVVGKGYGTFWNFRGRYRVVKGSRASKKSKTTALWYIWGLVKYPQANLLVVRKTERTLRDSCFADLRWAIHRLGLDAWFRATVSPLEITYTPTGQKVLFRGLDSPLKVTSVTVPTGVLCWLWIEEAYEIRNEDDFNTLDESIRGQVPDGLFKQVTLIFNPWNEKHWLKRRFFDAAPDPDILAMTVNYQCNEWLDESDQRMFERMARDNPRRYRVAGLGDWGIVEGLIFDNFQEQTFSLDEVRQVPDVKSSFGLDFGYTNDPSALFCGMISRQERTIWVFDELYAKGLSNEDLARRITDLGYRKEAIRADAAEPKSIARLRTLGLTGIRAARKGPDSVRNGIDFLQDYRILIHPRCVNFLTEINNYTWAVDKTGRQLNEPVDDFNHLMDAMRYALEDFSKPKAFSFE